MKVGIIMLTFENLFNQSTSLKVLKDESKSELERLKKNAQSKKCRSQKRNDLVSANLAITIINAIDVELEKYKDVQIVDINLMTIDELNKKIKSIQSIKCNAKAESNTDKYNNCIVEENKLLAAKDALGKQPKINKIQVKIDELKTLKQTKEIKAQIELLEQLL